MKAGDVIHWATANGAASGVILSGDGFNGYLVRLSSGRHAIVCPDYIPARKRQQTPKE